MIHSLTRSQPARVELSISKLPGCTAGTGESLWLPFRNQASYKSISQHCIAAQTCNLMLFVDRKIGCYMGSPCSAGHFKPSSEDPHEHSCHNSKPFLQTGGQNNKWMMDHFNHMLLNAVAACTTVCVRFDTLLAGSMSSIARHSKLKTFAAVGLSP